MLTHMCPLYSLWLCVAGNYADTSISVVYFHEHIHMDWCGYACEYVGNIWFIFLHFSTVCTAHTARDQFVCSEISRKSNYMDEFSWSSPKNTSKWTVNWIYLLCQIKRSSKIKINWKNNFIKIGNNRKMSPSQWLNGLSASDSQLLKMQLKLSSIRIQHHELQQEEQQNASRLDRMAQQMERMDDDLKQLINDRMEDKSKNKNKK